MEALRIAREVADQTGTLMAGNLCNSTIFKEDSDADEIQQVKAMFKVIYVLCSTHDHKMHYVLFRSKVLLNVYVNHVCKYFTQARVSTIRQPFSQINILRKTF